MNKEMAGNAAKRLTALRNLFPTLAVLSLFLMASPRASAQVPTPQTGGSGENAPPPTPTTADEETKKEGTPSTTAAPAKRSSKKHHAAAPPPDPDAAAEPDKILYDRAERDLKGGRYTEGRLALQTLINTYPDSEYLAKAKLAVADSYYKEGGTSNLTQAIQEYGDFQTFFPFLDEAAYAQMQIGMAHYKMMEKSDRDKTQAEAAEDAFQAFLLKYPQSPLVPKAEQDLRDVQEVLADGDYKVAYFYYRKFDYRASAARLVELTDRYPLYSQNDDALWMLGDIYQRAKQVSKNEDDKNHWGDLAARCYAKIARDYPLSKMAPDARERLKSMGKPVPAADPDAVVRMQKQQMYEKEHHQSIVLKLPLGMLKGSPDVADAAHTGTPQMNPPNDVVSATDILRPGAQGPSFTVTGGGAGANANSSSNSSEVVTPVDATTAPVGSNDAQTGVGVQIITPGEETPAPQTSPAPAAAVPPADPNVPVATPQPATGGDAPTVAPAPAGSAAPAAAAANPADSSSSSNTNRTSTTSGSAPATTAGQSEQAAQAAPSDSSQESTSKKKKGLKKLIPW
ncbi:MAG: outer membrane protein assembly factor BamD [Candidatus Acidiferrales bacterium]